MTHFESIMLGRADDILIGAALRPTTPGVSLLAPSPEVSGTKLARFPNSTVANIRIAEQVAQSYVAIPNKSNVDFERQSTFQCQIRAILKTNMPAVTYDASKGVTQKVWINGALVSQQTDSKILFS